MTAWVPSPPVSSRILLDAFVAALGDDVGGAEVAAQVGAVGVAAIRMICSAPSRLAASTAHSPTAPSPMTVTDVRGRTRAVTAPWWPVQNTSDSVSSEGISAESSATGSLTSVPWACGTRTASPWPASTPRPPQPPPWRQEVCRPSRQKSQVLSAQTNGATTRSPRCRPDTSAPTSSTMPMNSWPIRRPPSLCGMDWYGHRSLPQMHAR